MATEAKIKTRQKYLNKFDDIKVRVPKGMKEQYKALADSQGISLNQLVINLLNKNMDDEKGKSRLDIM